MLMTQERTGGAPMSGGQRNGQTPKPGPSTGLWCCAGVLMLLVAVIFAAYLALVFFPSPGAAGGCGGG